MITAGAVLKIENQIIKPQYFRIVQEVLSVDAKVLVNWKMWLCNRFVDIKNGDSSHFEK